MKPDLRWAVILTTNLFLYFLVNETNHYLSPFSFQIHLSGLFLAVGLLRLSLKQSLLNAAILGFLLDSGTPLPFGTTLLLFIGIHALFCWVRGHVNLEELTNSLPVAFTANALLFLSLTLIQYSAYIDLRIYLLRTGFEFFVSQVALLCLAPWFFGLQDAGLRFFGIEHTEGETEPARQNH